MKIPYPEINKWVNGMQTWFAWYPVRLEGTIVWLEYVKRWPLREGTPGGPYGYKSSGGNNEIKHSGHEVLRLSSPGHHLRLEHPKDRLPA